jgi:hypothetical protein
VVGEFYTPTRPRPVQINPRQTKQGQIKPSKIAWFYLVLFVRIWTFQWVAANPNKKFSLGFLLPTPDLTHIHGSLSEFLPSERLAQILLYGNHLLAHKGAVAFRQATNDSAWLNLLVHPGGGEIERFGWAPRLEKAVQSARTQVIEVGQRAAGRSIMEREVRRNDYLVEVRLRRQNIAARRKADWADWKAFFRENAHAARLHASGA